MKAVVFHTDLDNTIIYSYRHDIGAKKRCVEIYQEREVSFITQETYRLLEEVRRRACIVPTTTRTVEQYGRIDLGVGELPYALVCNGGVLLADGREEPGWYRDSLRLISDSSGELHKAMELLEREKRRTFELRFIRELFVFTKCGEPEQVVGDLRDRLDGAVVDVFHNGVKVYVVPKALNKGKAVDRFREYVRKSVHVDCVIAAGDSAFDRTMLEAADYGIATPELAGSIPCSDKIICPPLAGKKSYAEAVLETVLRICGG